MEIFEWENEEFVAVSAWPHSWVCVTCVEMGVRIYVCVTSEWSPSSALLDV